MLIASHLASKSTWMHHAVFHRMKMHFNRTAKHQTQQQSKQWTQRQPWNCAQQQAQNGQKMLLTTIQAAALESRHSNIPLECCDSRAVAECNSRTVSGSVAWKAAGSDVASLLICCRCCWPLNCAVLLTRWLSNCAVLLMLMLMLFFCFSKKCVAKKECTFSATTSRQKLRCTQVNSPCLFALNHVWHDEQ